MLRILAAIIVVLSCSTTAPAQEWNHELALYGWFCGIEGTIGAADGAEVPVEATFDDLANYLDFAMAAHYEAQNSSTVFIADFSYTNLGAERDAQVLNQPIKINADFRQWIIELGGGWRVSPEISLLLVGRAYIFDTGATIEAITSNSSDDNVSWVDIYVGGRWAKRLGSKWTVALRGDIGFGGSDFAWFTQAMVGYDLSDHFSLAAAWRILSLDREANVDTADYFKYDLTQGGPGLALTYGF